MKQHWKKFLGTTVDNKVIVGMFREYDMSTGRLEWFFDIDEDNVFYYAISAELFVEKYLS